MTARELWDHEARTDPRYASLAWGGDGSEEQVEPTITKIITNLTIAMRMRRAAVPEDFRPMSILEMGCGPGRLLHRLAREHPKDHFYGIDASEEMARLGDGDRPPNVASTIIADIGRPKKLLPATFDFIYSVEVFQHLDVMSKTFALSLLHHLLDRGGFGLVQFVDSSRPSEGPLDHPEQRRVMEWWADQERLTVVAEDDEIFEPVCPDWSWMLVTRP